VAEAQQGAGARSRSQWLAVPPTLTRAMTARHGYPLSSFTQPTAFISNRRIEASLGLSFCFIHSLFAKIKVRDGTSF
jgi:hypothetical protein